MEICFSYENDYIEYKKTTEQDKAHKISELNTDAEQVTEQVAEQVKRLILAVENDELSIKQIMQKLSMKHRPTIVYDYIKPALNLMLLEQTQPESPNSPTQKYRLTEKGKQYKKQLELGK